MFGHRKVPSFSFSSPFGHKDKEKDAPSPPRSEDGSRSRSRGRSPSPFRRNPFSKRDDSADGSAIHLGLPKNGEESEFEDDARTPVVCPSNAFETSDEEDSDDEIERSGSGSGSGPEGEAEEDEEEEDLGINEEEELELEKNTEANASKFTPLDFLTSEPALMTFAGEGPNLLITTPQDPVSTTAGSGTGLLRRKSTKTEKERLKMQLGRPVFERNRCTITLVQGDPVAKRGKRVRNYVVASDLSEESLFAIQWAIGTVLRDGDTCHIVSVIETDSKFDPTSDKPSSSEKKAKIANQRDRQANAALLSRQATALLERTRLNVVIECQSLHAKNARHMLVDIIDFFEPTMVIVGTRGLQKVKGMLLGSVSNYLIQKSSAPVMVTRRPLRVTRTVHKKLTSLTRESRVSLKDAAIEKDSHGGEVQDDPNEPEDVKEKVAALNISDK